MTSLPSADGDDEMPIHNISQSLLAKAEEDNEDRKDVEGVFQDEDDHTKGEKSSNTRKVSWLVATSSEDESLVPPTQDGEDAESKSSSASDEGHREFLRLVGSEEPSKTPQTKDKECSVVVRKAPSRPGLQRAPSRKMSMRSIRGIKMGSSRNLRHSFSSSLQSSASFRGLAGRMMGNQELVDLVAQREGLEEGSDTEISYFGLPWWSGIFFFSFVSLLFCLLQIFLPPPFGMRMTSAEVAATGLASGCDGLEQCVCPRETVCATDAFSMALLALARCSAFFDYPLYMMMFLTKAHNINNILRRTVLREWCDFGDMHRVHTLFGIIIGVETMSHSFFHMLRWGLNSQIKLLVDTTTGITGLVAMAATPLIVWPMIVPAIKKRLRFELRKGLHYLSWVWVVALLWHAPSRIYYLIGVPALLYSLDYVVGFFVRNNLVENVYFERYGENGVALHFKNPDSYNDSKTSYIYIMCPWISKYQWHAFTMFPEPTKENHTMLCIGKSGDWTSQMYEKIKHPCFRSIYVIGPFRSEFSDIAVSTSNAVAIASGIGITPTLSLMLTYAGKKRVNIIWMCRDPGLIEYFLHKCDIEAVTRNSFLLVFYTGKRDLVLPEKLPRTFFIFRQRPKLEETISGIIAAIHSGEGLPEEMYQKQKDLANISFGDRIKIALHRVTLVYSKEEMFDAAVKFSQKLRKTQADKNLTASIVEEGKALLDTDALDLDELVSLGGFEAMLLQFLGGVGEYSHEDLLEVFNTVDTDNSGNIDRKEFDVFLSFVTDGVVGDTPGSSEIMPSKRFAIEASDRDGDIEGFGNEETIDYMENLVVDPERPLGDWSIFYCGAAAPVEKTLRGIEKKYNMKVAIEKFNW
ncbi:hypothetical protein ACHAWF_015459 [Thalassiosira exigua]